MKKLVVASLLVGVFGIGCAVGTIAHNVTAPVAVAQTTPATAGLCSCVRSERAFHCVCNGLNCLISGTGSASCVPN